MDSLRNKAKELLDSKAVQVVVGYENGSKDKIRAAFITDATQINRLVFNEKCTQNLAIYLVKEEVKHMGKIAIVATIPVMRTINVLISECQVTEENLVVLGISPEGQLLDFPTISVMENYLQSIQHENPDKDKLAIEKIKKMTKQERWDYWKQTLETCFKCYACRAACPLCYCTRCAVECNQPQWIPVAPHKHGNMDWHMMRGMHLAGRCISCGECGRACPLDIPCHLLTMYLADEVHSMYGEKSGMKADMESVLSSYKPNDKENFIL